MMNANVLEGLKLIYKGIEEILKSCSQIENTAEEVETKKPTAKKSEKTTKEEAPSDSEELTREDLEGMSYNELKKLAKELGVSAAGNRKELVEKLLSGEEEAEEEAPKKSKTTKPSKKVEEPVEEEDEDESDDDESEDEEDISAKVEALLEDMDDDELRDILDDAGIPSKGKRQALISKIVNAVEDGVIELDLEDDEDEDEDEESEEVEEVEEDDESEETEDEESEESEDITANMTKKRKKAYDNVVDEATESYEAGDLTREDLISFINEYNGTKDKMKKVSDEDLLETYLKIAALFIDDDGNEIEEGAYYINEEPYCCGHPLKYDKKKKQYICETCGSAYDEE